jgi:hypothetical protein
MRFVEPVPQVRERAPERRREPPTAPVEQILALQRSAGNRAVARFLDVSPYDWEPDEPHGKTSHTDIPILLRELKGSAFERVLTAKEITKIEGVNAADLTATDIPSLATAIINGSWTPSASRP